MVEAVRGDRLAGDAATVPDVAAAVDLGVAVEELDIPAGLGHADAVLRARDRREVEDHHDEVVRIARVADDRDDAVLVVVAVNPAEARRIEVALVQRRLRPVMPVEILHVAPQRGMGRVRRADASRGCDRGSIRATARTPRP